jgi:hypothetical protein
VIVHLLGQFGLHCIKQVSVDDGGLFASQYPSLERDLADVEPVAQEMGEGASGEAPTVSKVRTLATIPAGAGE